MGLPSMHGTRDISETATAQGGPIKQWLAPLHQNPASAKRQAAMPVTRGVAVLLPKLHSLRDAQMS
jgi:hypothetical protein